MNNVSRRCLTDLELSDVLRDASSPHVASCPSCRARRDALRRPLDLLAQWQPEEPTDEALISARSKLLSAVTAGPPRRARWVAAASVAALLGLGAILAVDQARRGFRGEVEALSAATRFEHAVTRVGGGEIEDETVRVHEGRVAVEVAPLSARQRFRVIAGDGEVEVRGTEFDVLVVQDRLAAVSVREGVVVVRRGNDADVWLSAGESWTASASSAAVAPTVEAATAAKPTPTPTPTPTPLSTPTAAPLALSPARPERARVVSANPRAEASETPRAIEAPGANVPPPAPIATPTASVAQPRRVVKPIEVPKPELAVAPPPARVDVAEAERMFQRGWALYRAKDRRAAIEALTRAESLAGDDPVAEDAAYWRAIALAELRDPGLEAALRAFLARYGAGRRAPSIALLLAERLVETDRAEARDLLKGVAAGRDAAAKAKATEMLEELED